MAKGLFLIIVVSVACLAVAFQAVGFFAPAWMRFQMNIPMSLLGNLFGGDGINGDQGLGAFNNDNGMGDVSSDGDPGASGIGDGLGNLANMMLGSSPKIYMNQGLWYGSSCVEVLGQSQCQKQIYEAMSGEADLTAEKVLCSLGVAAAAIGGVFLLLFIQSEVDKGLQFKALLCILGWGISAVSVFIAVGLGVKEQGTFKDKLVMPLTLMGAPDDMMNMQLPWAILMSGIGAFLSIVVGVIVGVRTWQLSATGLPGTWNRFSNAAV